MFSVEPDMHIDSLEQAETIVLEGTSKWSCKIEITGQRLGLLGSLTHRLEIGIKQIFFNLNFKPNKSHNPLIYINTNS